jgi:ankyrin repeat protein
MPGMILFQQRFEDRRRRMVAQCFANEQWDVLHSLLVRNPELAKPQQRPVRSSTSSSSHTNNRGGTGGVLQWGTDGSWTLLHFLVYQPSTPNDLIAYVAQLDDGAAGRCQNSIAETPLHLCCDRARPDWDRIRLLLRSAPATTTQQHADGLLLRDSFGRTSFFLACANNAPIDILQDFISINRRVVSVRDAFSDHPLECLSCRLYGGGGGSQTTNEQVRQLHSLVDKLTLVAVEEWQLRPTCPWWDITRENRREYLLLAILHIKPSLLDVILRVCCGGIGAAATSSSSTTTMRPLPILSSGCFWKRDAHGNLPLHVALRQPRTPMYSLPELLRLAPGTAKIPTGDDGQLLPIHLAVRRQQQQESAAGAVDSSRCRPLLPFLLQAHPEALSQVVASTGLLPFQDAASRDDDVTVIYTLLRSKPDLLSSRRAIIKTPLSSPSSSDRSSVSSSGYHSSSNKNQSSRGRCSI